MYRKHHLCSFLSCFLLFPICSGANSEEQQSKQALATTPAELVEMLEDVSFMPPDKYREMLSTLRESHSFPIALEQLPQYLDEDTDPRKDITAEDIKATVDVLTRIAVQSKEDGEILWGRIQGTRYEREAHQWLYEQLQSYGFEKVHYEKLPVQVPQWRPTVNDLVVTQAPGFKPGETFRFSDAVTAFPSAVTPDDGVTAPVVYVGDATAAELQGRDLQSKIVLMRGRTHPSVMINSARTAYSRVASGRYGMPAGVVVWWDIPSTKQVAGRVGSPGGGDSIGKAVPWTTIGNDDGYYLRKLIDRATPEKPVIARLNIQGRMESGKDRMTGYVYGMLPGQSGDYIVIPSHVDGYFYGIHDNGGAVALNLALAKHYISIPEKERKHGLIFLFHGDHEVPGLGNTLAFVNDNRELMTNNLLMVLRPEHFGMTQQMDEALLVAKANSTEPLMLMVTNRSPVIIDLFLQAAMHYGIVMGGVVYPDPAADEAAWHPPYNDIGAISTGWVQTTPFYHSTGDVDIGGVDLKQLEKITRAHAFIIDELFNLTKSDLRKNAHPEPEKSIYQSDLMKIILGNY